MDTKYNRYAKKYIGTKLVKLLINLEKSGYPHSHIKKLWLSLSKNSYITCDVIEQYSDKPWNYNGLSDNPNITFDYVIKKRKPWNWKKLCQHPNFTIDEIKSHPKLNRHIKAICYNPNLTLEYINENVEYLKETGLLWRACYNIKNITGDELLTYSWVPETIDAFITNPNFVFTTKFINQYYMEILQCIRYKSYKDDISYYYHSFTEKNLCNEMIDLNKIVENKMTKIIKTIILEYYEKIETESKRVTCTNPDITIDYLFKHRKNKWYWVELSKNPAFKPEDINKYSVFKRKWSWFRGLSQNPSMTIDFVKKNRDKKWCWRSLSHNPGITMNDIEKNLHLPWDWSDNGIIKNPNLRPEFVEKYYKHFTTKVCAITQLFKNTYNGNYKKIQEMIKYRLCTLDKRIEMRNQLKKRDVKKYFE